MVSSFSKSQNPLCHFDWSKSPGIKFKEHYHPVSWELLLRNGEVWGKNELKAKLMFTFVPQLPPLRSVAGQPSKRQLTCDLK
jgi:hypothetical protein